MAREYQCKFDGVSPARLRELRGFCEQYTEKRKQASQTKDEAERARLLSDVAMIDHCLLRACDDEMPMVEALRDNVVLRYGVRRLQLPPCSITTLYRKRAAFFRLLNDLHGKTPA